jgi:hypothetical protein
MVLLQNFTVTQRCRWVAFPVNVDLMGADPAEARKQALTQI